MIELFDMFRLLYKQLSKKTHMLLLNLFIYKILALHKYIHTPERISLIVDVPIDKILNEDDSIPNGVILKEDVAKNEMANEFIWDKYCPKAFFYFIEFENPLNLTNEGKLKCLSNEEEKMFSFEIVKKLSDLSNFTVNEINKLNVRKRDKGIHEYIIGSKERYYESVMEIFNYTSKIETIPLLYFNVIRMFNVFSQGLRTILQESMQMFENDRLICLKIWELNKRVIKISISIIKSLATLRIPSLNKLEYLEPFEQFMSKKDSLTLLIKDLKDIISIQLTNCNQNNIENKDFDIQKFCNNAFLIIKNFEDIDEITINEKYNKFMDGLKLVSQLSEEIKNKNDTKITFNFEDKIVENFIDKYYSLFLEYCDIMGGCDEVYLDEYLYHSTLNFGDTYKKDSEEMFFDIVVAKEMRKYLEIYIYDKTDFLIFARTDFFKNKLFDKILNNLHKLTHSLIIEKKIKGEMYENKFNLSQEDQDLKARIGDLYNQLDPIFKLVKKTKSLLVCEDINISYNVHKNLSDSKNQIGNEKQTSDEEKIEQREKGKTDQNGNEINLEDGNKSDADNYRDHANLDGNQSTNNEQKIVNLSLEDSNRSYDENPIFDQNFEGKGQKSTNKEEYEVNLDNSFTYDDKTLICNKVTLDECQKASNEKQDVEIDLTYVPETKNYLNIDETGVEEKSQEFNISKNENEQFEKGDLKAENLLKRGENMIKENHQVKSVRFKLNHEQDRKNESNLTNVQSFNDENKLKDDSRSHEYKPPIYNNKKNHKQYDDEKSNSEGYYIFHIILVMFAAVSLIVLFIFCVFDKR